MLVPRILLGVVLIIGCISGCESSDPTDIRAADVGESEDVEEDCGCPE